MADVVPLIDLESRKLRLGDRVTRAMLGVVEHGQFINGPEIRELEDKLAEYCGVAHVVTCSSGTDALLLTLLAWGVGPGDAVLVPAFTFVATAEAVALTGATPVFVDVDPVTFCLEAKSLRSALESLSGGPLGAVGVIPVDLFGQPADYPALADVAGPAGLWVLADAAQSFGSALGGRRTGMLADATATSFFPSKPLSCYGDGGAVLTNDESLASELRSRRAHGQGTSKYDNVRVGINGRLDTIQAAVVLQHLTVLDEELAARTRIAARYSAELGGVVATPTIADGASSSWAHYTITVDDRDRVAAELSRRGITTAVYYPKPMHEQPAYTGFPQSPTGLDVATRLAGTVLSLPMHPYLTASDQQRVVDGVVAAVRRG